MSFFRHPEIYRSDVFDWSGSGASAAPGFIVCDEFPAGYSSADCSPAGSASASPTADHFALKSSCRSMAFHRTANSVLTVCLSPGGHPKGMFHEHAAAVRFENGFDDAVFVRGKLVVFGILHFGLRRRRPNRFESFW